MFSRISHSYTPTGKGRVLRGAFSSTAHTGTGTGSGGGSGTKSTEAYHAIGVTAAVGGSVAYAVHQLDQREMAHVQDKAATEIRRIHDKAATEMDKAATEMHKAATEIKRIQDKAATDVARIEGERKSEVARVEGERKLSEERLKAEVERYKQDVLLAYTEDYKPYQTAM